MGSQNIVLNWSHSIFSNFACSHIPIYSESRLVSEQNFTDETKYKCQRNVTLTNVIQKLTLHGETFYINFYYSIFQFREKCITLRIFVSKNIKLYNNDMKLQHSS